MLETEPMSTPNRVRIMAAPQPAPAKKQIRHVGMDALGLHVLGDLPIFQRSQVEAHLSGCHTCRSAQRRVAEAIAVFRAGVYAARAY